MKYLALIVCLLSCAGDIKGDKGDPGIPGEPGTVITGITPVASVYNDGIEFGVVKLVNILKVERDPQTNEFIYTLKNPMKTPYNYGIICSLNGGGITYPPIIIARPLGTTTFAVQTWVPSFGNVSIAHSCFVFEP